MSIIHKAPRLLKPISSQLIWEINSTHKDIYLTFDDGPHPEITPWVLAELKKHKAKATFFLVGENAEKYPDVVKMILDAGHHIGNHTFNHVKGWSTSAFKYYRNTLKCEKYFETPLFRPPYGRITRAQHNQLSKRYRIIMWSVLSGDYDRKLLPAKIISGVIENTVPGSVIVFHDSIKAEKNLKESLPEVLNQLSEKGFQSKVIPYNLTNSQIIRGEGKS
jgi:peptidoglycan/xylan/chitin deacetylase (PgdA/CDA1 family)